MEPLLEMSSPFDVLLISKDQKHHETSSKFSTTRFTRLLPYAVFHNGNPLYYSVLPTHERKKCTIYSTSHVYYRQQVKLECGTQSPDDVMRRTRGDRTVRVCVKQQSLSSPRV